MSRSFMHTLLAGATSRLFLDAPTPGEAVLAAIEVHPPVPVPHDYQKARNLIVQSLARLTSRQEVLMREIQVRQAELYETNRTIEALDLASAAIEASHTSETVTEPEPDDTTAEEDTAIYRAIAEGVLPEFKVAPSVVEDDPANHKYDASRLLREATSPPKGPVPYGIGFKPPGFA